MSNYIFIGQARNEQRNRHALTEFEAFHDLLSDMPEPRTAQLVEDRALETATAYTLNFGESTLPDNYVKKLVFDHVLSAMAEEQLEIYQGHRQPNHWGLGWLAFSRESLDAALCWHEYDSQVRKESLFFNTDGLFLRRIGVSALAATKPWGMYSRYAFASGVGHRLVGAELS
jgi:hypothetical protein